MLSTEKTYVVHDNGRRPFMVVKNGSIVKTYKAVYNEDTEKYEPGEKIGHYENVLEFFDGLDPVANLDGNSILFLASTLANADGNKYTYIFVGREIYQFCSNEKIIDYVSPMGNSDIPYPYAVTETKTYLMIEDVHVSNADLINADLINGKAPTALEYNLENDPYGHGVGHTSDKVQGQLFRKTVIHARRWW